MASSSKTRSVSKQKYGGSACDLPGSDLPTNSDIARYYYFVSLSEKDIKTQIHLVERKLMEVWTNCNPRLPLMEKLAVYKKLRKFLDKVKGYNQKHLKPAPTKVLLAKKDQLFDISACSCNLPVAPCTSKYIRCSIANCETEHIACECQPQHRVPVEEREFMRDQRNKRGTRGTFQMGPVDRTALAKEKLLEAAKVKRLATAPLRRGQRIEEVAAVPVFEVCLMLFNINMFSSKGKF